MRAEILAFTIYLKEECELSDNTVDTYIFAVREFLDMFDALTKYNLLEYKRYLQSGGKKPTTINLRITALNKYCKFQKAPELCIKQVKAPKKSFSDNVITEEEYYHLLSCLLKDGNEKWYWITRFLAQTGARVSEFIRMPKSCLKKGYYELNTKGRYRRIYIPDRLIKESREFFLKQKNESDFLFTNMYGQPLSSRGVSQQLKNFAKKYKVRPEVMYPHSFRHLYAIQFLKRNSNIALLADLMGHADVSTTSLYLRLSQQQQAELLDEAMNW